MQEAFIQELEEIQESYFEDELIVEGEYVTESTMFSWGYTEQLASN